MNISVCIDSGFYSEREGVCVILSFFATYRTQIIGPSGVLYVM